jgi:hypothetical protein
MPTETFERQALLANDIRVLVSQLNDAINSAAEQQMKIVISVAQRLEIQDDKLSYPVLSAQIYGEIE